MDKQIGPEDLSPSELNLLVAHLKLGSKHLQAQLTKRQFREFLQWSVLNERQKSLLKAGILERLSQMAPALNTIITSVFGVFIGLSILLGFDGSGPVKFCFVCCLACLAGGWIGYLSVRTAENEAQAAILDLKINKFLFRILDILNKRVEKKVIEAVDDLNKKSEKLAIYEQQENDIHLSDYKFESEEENHRWFEQIGSLTKRIVQNIPKDYVYELYKIDILRNLNLIKIIIIKEGDSAELNLKSPTRQTQGSLEDKKKLPFIQILTDPAFSIPKASTNFKPWWRENLASTLFQLIPMMVGTFASLFVFINGIPGLVKELHIFHLENLISLNSARVVELTIMILLTLYFGGCFLYTIKRDEQRAKEILRLQQNNISQESVIIANNNRLQMLSALQKCLGELFQIVSILQKLTSQSNQQASKENSISCPLSLPL